MYEKFEKEIASALEQLALQHCGFKEVGWFLENIARHFGKGHLTNAKPDVLVLGEELPQEFVRALAKKPFFLLGGSLEATRWSDSLVPRDADPISRAALGFLLNEDVSLAEGALVVIALTSDNRRKLAGILQRQGIRVATFDMPSEYSSEDDQEALVSELLRLAEEISTHTHLRLTVRRLRRAAEEKRQMYLAMANFRNAVWRVPGGMSAALRETILESCWYAEEPSEWAMHLKRLTAELMAWSRQVYQLPDHRPRVLMAGSPVIFLNEKIPMLLENAGLYLADRADTVATQADQPGARKGYTVKGILRQMLDQSLPKADPGAFATAIQERLERLPIDGIVYHVLKGQIAYDFEFPRIERLALMYGVPVLRLETDYQQQDVEQLRIRLEAFSEMLWQRNADRLRKVQ